MAENVQWIRLKVGMFDGNSFKKIKRAKIGGVSYRDKLTSVWFELLDLAGKSNANGFLIDNNEIPYHSYEDIAIMLDREEKEIELCMQFFINEKMIEIIDDVYCLSNFVRYQNQDGLEKIREQKRIAQAKWRERKKLGLVGENVDKNISTVDSTDHLLSISNSISTSNLNVNDKENNTNENNGIPMNTTVANASKCYQEQANDIFNYWNNKDIIKHKCLNDDILKAIEKALKIYSVDEIKTYIDRYKTVIDDKSFFFDYKWKLNEFLSRKEGISAFADDGSKWNSYLSQRKPTNTAQDYFRQKNKEYVAKHRDNLDRDDTELF